MFVTLSARIEKIRLAYINNQTLFALRLTPLTIDGNRVSYGTCNMSIYSNYLPGRHDLPRMALADAGDILDIELRGLDLRNCEDDESSIFLEFLDIGKFKIHTPKVVQGSI